MTACHVQASGGIELYFYGELEPGDRVAVEEHLRGCRECQLALDELRTIRAALASCPDVAAPPGGDWTGFMARLERAVREAPAPPATGARLLVMSTRRLAPYLAMAALLALVTLSVLLVVREPDSRETAGEAAPMDGAAAIADGQTHGADAALASLGEQHFERSKLVVLGLATRDPGRTDAADWAYERELASSLLNDTRLYRQTAEQHGMPALAGVMRDLELVLLQTAMSDDADAASLERLQRLIRRRDLITKMSVVRTAGLAP